MTNNTISVLFIMTVLMTSATAASVELIPNADALKSMGNPLLRTGSAGSVVCGDRLCSEVRSESSTETVQKQPDLSPTNVPIDIPLTMGYVNGHEVFYISTEASVEDVADHLTDITGFRVAFTPALALAPDESLAQIYAFTNGIEGDGAFGFQPQVADSQPGDDKYSPLWNVNAVTWNDGSEPRELKSEMEILDAQEDGEISIESTGAIVNCPFVKWDGGEMQVRENSQVSEADPYGGGQVLNIDLESMTVTFVAHLGLAPNGDTIYYIATDASDQATADGLGIVFAPRVHDTLLTGSSSDLYVFTNGLEGNGPLGFQASIGSTTVGDAFYSPLWRIQAATWNTHGNADFLQNTAEINEAVTSGKLQTALAGFVVNCPFVEIDGMTSDAMMEEEAMMEEDAMMEEEAMMEEDAMMDETMMEEEAMMDDTMMEEETMMEDTMMEEETMMEEDAMMDETMMDDTMMEEETMMEEDAMMDETMMDDTMMEEDAMMDDTMIEEDAMMDETMMDDTMMEEEAMMDDTMMGDLTAPLDDMHFGGEPVGTYLISVEDGNLVSIVTSIDSVSPDMVLEGWLVDMDTDYKLSIGTADHDGDLMFTQSMVNPWIYDAIVITEEPINDSNPAPNVPIGGVSLEAPFGQ